MRRSPFVGTGLVLGLFAVAGCTLNTDYFSEYRGKNLLGNYGLGTTNSDGSSRWNLATSTDYMTWEPISYTANGDPSNPKSDSARDQAAGTPLIGPDGTSPVYRLEIKNLIPNGDFEDADDTADGQTSFWAGSPAQWSTYEGTNPATTLYSPSAPLVAAIDGRSMTWEAKNTGDQLRLNLTQAIKNSSPASTSVWQNGGYRFHCDFININFSQTSLEIYATPTSDLTAPVFAPYPQVRPNPAIASRGGDWTTDTGTNHTSVFGVSEFVVVQDASAEDWSVVFGAYKGSDTNIQVVLDNVRLLPRDTSNLLAVANLPTLASGTLPLLPGSKQGMYNFSILVRDDPTIGDSSVRSRLNRFQPLYFTVEMKAAEKSTNSAKRFPIERPAGGWPTWTKISFDMGFDFVDSDGDHPSQPALSVGLSPTRLDTGTVDVGSVLVCQPVLSFNP